MTTIFFSYESTVGILNLILFILPNLIWTPSIPRGGKGSKKNHQNMNGKFESVVVKRCYLTRSV